MADETNQQLVSIIGNQLLEMAKTQVAQGTQITRSTALLEELVGTSVNPGRLPKLEAHVDGLRAEHNKAKGLGIAWGAFLTIIAAIFTYFKAH